MPNKTVNVNMPEWVAEEIKYNFACRIRNLGKQKQECNYLIKRYPGNKQVEEVESERVARIKHDMEKRVEALDMMFPGFKWESVDVDFDPGLEVYF